MRNNVKDLKQSAVKIYDPDKWGAAEKLAEKLLQGGLVPLSFFRKDNTGKYIAPSQTKIAGIIIAGTDLGFSPFEALEKIIIMSGKLTLTANAYKTLVYRSGMIEAFKTELKGEPDALNRTAICTIHRKGMKEPINSSFSLKDAIDAGLYDPKQKERNNISPWYKYTDKMLIARAQTSTIRDGFSDVLKGAMYTEEELQPSLVTDPTTQDITVNNITNNKTI